MIKPSEIQKKSRAAGVRDQQIEKDYIISWILQGIANHKHLSHKIIFKGGTVLKKVYFKDYRFSEDLDFTLWNNNISNNHIIKWFSEIFEFIQEETNIPLETTDNNKHKDGGINFYISYVGPLGGLGANKKVKVDIARTEKMEFKPLSKNLFLSYSDQVEHKLLCYSLEEILLEKMRSVIQRMQARDLYDIWYLLEIYGINIDFCINEFKSKCVSKKLDPSVFKNKLEQRLPQYKGRWKKSMKEQIKNLPEFEKVEREIMRHFRNLDL